MPFEDLHGADAPPLEGIDLLVTHDGVNYATPNAIQELGHNDPTIMASMVSIPSA